MQMKNVNNLMCLNSVMSSVNLSEQAIVEHLMPVYVDKHHWS